MHRSAAKFIATATCSFLLLVTHARLQELERHDHHNTRAESSCTPLERDALLAFKQGITQDYCGFLDSWRLGHDCCNWTGVTCSRQSGHVIMLDLGEDRNWNQCPPISDYHTPNLVGQISPSLLSLEYLEYLDLSFNDLEGPNKTFPEFLVSMTNLRHLALHDIQFSGTVPSLLSNLTKLGYLDLSYTSFFGRLPNQLGNLSNLQYLDLKGMDMVYSDISWLSHLQLLEYLNMSWVNLSMAVDWSHVLNSIPSIKVVILEGCSLPSTEQSLLTQLNLTKLQDLDLSLNSLHQPVASTWFWNITSIESLSLSQTNLYGPFPDALGRMTNLQVLDFSLDNNGVTMSADMLENLCALRVLNLDQSLSSGNITEFLERLLLRCSSNNLHILFLEGNNMTGFLPDRLWHLTNIFLLDLSNNSITGSIPPGIGNLSGLDALDLSDNSITGSIPPGIGNFSGLYILYLSDNRITGSIPPGIGNLSNLLSLDLSHNYISGHVPTTSWMCLNNLTTLDLSHNNLNGVITEQHLSTLEGLTYIDLSHNSLQILVSSQRPPPFTLDEANFASCQMGPDFPTWLKSQARIGVLDMSSTGIVELPDWVFQTFRDSSYLDFSNNAISGAMPSNLTAMVQLQELYMNSNLLSGQMPVLPDKLSKLDISQNSLSGPLPSEFGGQNIMELIMYSNNITGHIPKYICHLKYLLVLDLSNNSVDGQYPRCFGMSSIVFLLLSNNALSGNFPSSLRNHSRLAFLDLSWNNFSGTLPVWIGDLVYIRFLQLSHNRFFGDIPMTITNLKRLQHLNLAGNTMSGAIPSSLLSLRAMRQKHHKRPGLDMYVWYSDFLGEVKDVLSVVFKRQELKYGAGIFKMVGIDLSLNQLTGGVPDEINSLNGLLNLNLSWNHLDGQIPEKIGSIKSMESLDLSRNNFSGEIPPSLSDLTYLSYLDLSYNNLTGQIPQGRQLDTLYLQIPSMYDGNSGLCGPPLQRNCSGSNSQVTHGQVTREKNSELGFFYIGLGSGFMVGLWVVFCAMLFKKAWRIACFRFVDRAYDKVYVLVVVTCGRLARDGTRD